MKRSLLVFILTLFTSVCLAADVGINEQTQRTPTDSDYLPFGDVSESNGSITTFGNYWTNHGVNKVNAWLFTDDHFPVTICVAASDESTDLTTGTAKVTFRMPYAMTVSTVRASVNTAPVGATLNVDINEGGSSILSTVLSIDASEETSVTAATAAVISDSSLADDAEITIDIDQIGSTTSGRGLKICLDGVRVY